MPDKPQKQATAKAARKLFQYQFLPDLLVDVYSYRLMMTCVYLAIVVCGSWFLLNPVTCKEPFFLTFVYILSLEIWP